MTSRQSGASGQGRRLIMSFCTVLIVSCIFLSSDVESSSPPVNNEGLHVHASDLDSALQRLKSTVDELSALLEERQTKAAASANEDGTGKKDALVESLNARKSALAERQANILDKIAKLNAAQLQQFVGRVNATYQGEISRRASWADIFASCSSADSTTDANAVDSSAGGGGGGGGGGGCSNDKHVPKESLTSVLDQASIMTKSEQELETWTTKLATEVINGFTEKKIRKLKAQEDYNVAGAVAPTSENPEYTGCAALLPTASVIFSSLQSGASAGGSKKLFDHASSKNGGSIVYGEAGGANGGHPLTSKPYIIPPADGSDDIRVGEAWWRRYIPEDWERLLDVLTDRQWEEKKVQDLLPINTHSQSASSILNSDSDLGLCYPISTKHNSRVTIRLAYPILLTGVSISLNHCGPKAPTINSTDLSVTLEGYQPCWLSVGAEKEREECERRGFDDRSIQLGKFDYQASSRSMDTFCVHSGALDETPQLPSDEEEEQESGSSGQCTFQYEGDGPKSSCQDDGDSNKATTSESDAMPSLIMSGELLSGDEESAVVEAVGIVFDQNMDWDCTCVHRISLHGEPIMR